MRWFSSRDCVRDVDGHHELWLGGTLAGRWNADELGARNVLLIGLAVSETLVLRDLAAAFGVSFETLRLIRRQYEKDGLRAIVARGPNRTGPAFKIDGKMRARLETMFAAGHTIDQVFARVGKRWKLGRSTIGDARRQWVTRAAGSSVEDVAPPHHAPAPIETPPVAEQMRLVLEPEFTGPSTSPTPIAARPRGDELDTPLRSGRGVQHLGVWLLLAVVHRLGLYASAEATCEGAIGTVSLRVALDALISAFAIGEHTAEGVRRLATPTAPLLLRTRRAPSPAWVRATLGNFTDVETQRGGRLMLRMLERYLGDEDRAAREGEPFLLYIDNHLRPYTGKHTVRRGWRMQDKRVRPGISDYWLHDEDGRPLYRVDVPSHDSLVHWLVPMANRLRVAAPERQAHLFAFDRAGAYPSAMSELLEAGVQAVTYERKPYPLIKVDTFFTETVVLGKETFHIGESVLTHRRSRLPLRRIVVRDGEGKQINLLSTSNLPARRLLEIMIGRWVQENGFKHGVERWGANQLDRREVELVPNGTVVPNPARRRLDHALRLVMHEEGAVRIALSQDTIDDTLRRKLTAKLKELVARRSELMAQRPSLPKKAPVEQTELAGKLKQHVGDYKALFDTVRVACANAESELAAILAPSLEKPAEAKKLLAAVFASPGRLRVGERGVAVDLAPAASRPERHAIQALLRTVSAMGLMLPGDQRPVRFRLQT